MRSGLPDGTAARAQRDMSMAGVQRGRQAAELMAAGAKLSKMGGDETARVAYMSGELRGLLCSHPRRYLRLWARGS